MGLLAPLYALAALAIAGPIIFHLIRRQPQGHKQFSSLMFLSPSPPRLTRRSRLDNFWLLCLRALAILLIAVAFARPYLRQESFLNSSLSGRQVVAVLDTSGSMQRNDVWRAAQDELRQLLDSLSAEDRVALYTTDVGLTPVVPLDDANLTDARTSQAAVRSALADLAPSWQATQLSGGLKTVADAVQAASISGKIDPSAQHEIVLITDLHSDSQLEALQGYPWPESIQLDVRQVRPTMAGNARPSLMLAATEDQPASEQPEDSYRVRVENNADSAAQTFELVWSDENGPLLTPPTTIQVPPGQVRIVPLAARPSGADRIVLSGDAWDGDNTVYVAEPISSLERIIYVGSSQSQAENDLSYFLKRAPLSSELYRREIVAIQPQGLPAVLAEAETKAVVLEPIPEVLEQASSLRQFADEGGTVLVCLSRPLSDLDGTNRFLSDLLAVPAIQIEEAATDDFALLSAINFQHPVFAPFADPRFNDFGKIRFWSHRKVSLPEEDSSTWKVLASYDDQSPMLIEQPLGEGRVWLITAGWQPTASGLGLSSKFVPLLIGLLDPTGRTRGQQLTFAVGEPIDTQALGEVSLVNAQGAAVDEHRASWQGTQLNVLQPGLYWLQGDNFKRQLAIQVPTSESHLTPLDTAIFEQYGVPLGKVASDQERRAALRQLQVVELERKQRLWQWLLAGCIGILAVETFLAGWLSRRGVSPPSTA